MRWNHPVRGILPPSEFIDIAEQSRLINAIGEWTLRESCTKLRLFEGAGNTGGVCVIDKVRSNGLFVVADAMMAEDKGREHLVPGIGDMAPDFTAERLGAGRKRTGEFVTLSKLRGRPVALAFGSYT